MRGQRFIILGAMLALVGCASAPVQRGALIGAGTGVLLGAGTGYLVSDDSLLGTKASKQRGDVSLEQGSSVVAGSIVGALFGALVGAMVGKANDTPDVPPDDQQPTASASPSPSAF